MLRQTKTTRRNKILDRISQKISKSAIHSKRKKNDEQQRVSEVVEMI